MRRALTPPLLTVQNTLYHVESAGAVDIGLKKKPFTVPDHLPFMPAQDALRDPDIAALPLIVPFLNQSQRQ